jgi:gamma-glutamyl-gamma-aminobutyrate hydrolase PuuD
VNPALYGQEPHPETDGPPDEERDLMEMTLIKAALEQDLPLLCICKGMQLFNIVHGGDLNQHIAEAGLHRVKPPPGKRHEIVHSINVEPESRLHGILGVEEHPVNSRHHQAVSHVGQYLKVSGRAPDGVIEAVERPDRRFALGCQWHPEESIFTNPGDRKILEAFRDAL